LCRLARVWAPFWETRFAEEDEDEVTSGEESVVYPRPGCERAHGRSSSGPAWGGRTYGQGRQWERGIRPGSASRWHQRARGIRREWAVCKSADRVDAARSGM